MVQLTVSEAAATLIQQELLHHAIEDPVVNLVQESAARPTNPALSKAIREGTDDHALRELALKLHGNEIGRMKMRLVPHAHSRTQHRFPAEFLIEASGIVFCFPPEMIKRMNGWILDTGQNGLELRDEDGVVVLPLENLPLA